MFTLLKRTWRYATAALSGRLERLADPKVQIEQAIEEGKRQHQLLSQQAAAVVGNRRQLEIRLARTNQEVEHLQGSARRALTLAAEATRAGDAAKAAAYEEAAHGFALKLVATESSLEDLKALHQQATASAEAAKRAVEQHAFALRRQLAERAKLLSQLEHTKMQERMNDALRAVGELAVTGDVPTLGQVRDKLEARYALALGHQEMAAGSAEVHMLEIEKATLDAEASQRLAILRESLGLPPAAAAPAPPGLEAGAPPSGNGS